MNELTRRDFCAGCAVATLAGCAPPDAVFFDTDSGTPDATEPVDVSVRDRVCAAPVPTGPERVALPLSEYPDLATVGGWIAMTSSVGAIVVARVADDCVVAIQRACAHEGELIDFVPASGRFVCPRHAATYEWDGSVVAGPISRGQSTWPAGIDGDTIYVDFS